jgi:hypothetical protein
MSIPNNDPKLRRRAREARTKCPCGVDVLRRRVDAVGLDNSASRAGPLSGRIRRANLGAGAVFVLFDPLAEREPMAVGGSKRELTHPPRFVSWRLQDLGPDSYGPPMKRVDVVHIEVRDIAVIANLAGGRNLRAAAEHKWHVAGATEPPVARVDVMT